MKMQNKTKKSNEPVHPDWATKHRKPGTELRFLDGRYYLYSVSSKYDPILKRAKKLLANYLVKSHEEKDL